MLIFGTGVEKQVPTVTTTAQEMVFHRIEKDQLNFTALCMEKLHQTEEKFIHAENRSIFCADAITHRYRNRA